MREPHQWFPEARKMKRKFIYHHGPTNSGKTHAALLELEKANNGIYCSPLRLLAWEVSPFFIIIKIYYGFIGARKIRIKRSLL